ncbi:Protein mpe1 [Binucleata daphniae]
MSNFINYRFFSSKNYTKLYFQGTLIPLWEFRIEIIQQQKMTSTDFDLLFFDDDLAPILDEYQTVSRNSNIIIKRIPLWMSTKKEYKQKETIRKAPANAPKPFFDGYICFRCGQKDHFIQNCPTNTDKNYDYVRVRKPTGIPKAFLQAASEGEKSEAGMLVTNTGLVKVVPQLNEFKKLGETMWKNVPKDLKCIICNSLYSQPVITDCSHVFCKTCVTTKIACAICGNKIQKIESDDKMQEKVTEFTNTR